MATIDNLTLEIKADASKATTALDNLSNSLEKLQENMSGIGTGFKTLVKDLSKISVSSSNLTRIRLISTIGRNLSTLNTVKSDNIGKTATNLTALTQSLGSITTSKTSTEKIKSISYMAKYLSKLNDVKGNNIGKTADGLKGLTNSLKGISLSKTSSQQVKELSSIAENLAKFNGVKPNVIQKSADGIASMATSLNSISIESIEKLERIADALQKIPQHNAIKSAVSAVKKVEDVAPKNEMALKESEVEGSIQRESEVALENTNKVTQNVGNFWTKFQTISSLFKKSPISLLASSENAEGMSNLAEASGIAVGTLTKFSKVLGGIGIAISVATVAIKALKKAFDFFISPIKKAVKAVSQFVKALSRIAFYRFIRGVLKGITQGVKEGTQNLALYSKAMNELDAHSANHVMSRYASEFLYFKNAVATAVIPVLRAMIPLIEQVINKVIDLINVIAQIGSAFFGSTFTKAKYFWVDYADSLDNATGRAKALHHQLAGFDELNNLTAPSGGSGSTDLLDPSKMFEEANISSKILDKVEKIKKVIEKIKEFGKDILNMLSPMSEKGKEIADWFERLWERVSPNVEKVWELIEKIWDKLGQPLGEGFVKGFVDGFFGTFTDEDKIEKIGRFSDVIGKLADKIGELVDKIDEDKVKRFGEILGYIVGSSLKDLPFTILGLISPLANVVIQFKRFNDTAEDNADLIKKVVDKLAELDTKTKEVIEPIKTLCLDLKFIIEEIGEAIEKAYEDFTDFGDVELAWEGFVGRIEKIFDRAKSIIGGDLDAIKDKILNLISEIPIIGVIAEYFSDGKSNKNINPAKASLGKGYSSTTIGKVGHYASGGYIDNGDLFIANERGAEMVGSIGNQTAVANNDQITQAIATATYNAMSKALSENNGSVTFVVEGDGDQMYKIWQKKNREYGRKTGLAY